MTNEDINYLESLRFPINRIPKPGNSVPNSTYRLQLNSDFTFNDVCKRIPYFKKLGVSHLYLSPILQSVPGSKHGYDVINHNSISNHLGTIEDFKRMSNLAHENNIGIIVDIVPNHMALPEESWQNHQLFDVLKKGKNSCYKHWFDINWEIENSKIVLPILSKHIYECIESNDFEIVEANIPSYYNENANESNTLECQWILKYGNYILPIKENTQNLPIEQLLLCQNYSLEYWRSGEDDINYRRFFDIKTLIGLKIDDRDVFENTHKLIFNLIKTGFIDGLRIDHIDGLVDPKKYLDWLYESTGGIWVVVEKILLNNEELEDNWKVCGTTGYDALNKIQHSLLNPYGYFDLLSINDNIIKSAKNIQALEKSIGDNFGISNFTGYSLNSRIAIKEAKVQILQTQLYPDLNRILNDLQMLSESNIKFKDHSRRSLRTSLQGIITNFSNYRPYIHYKSNISKHSQNAIKTACETTREELSNEFNDSINLIESILLHEIEFNSEYETIYASFLNNFSQVCSSLCAKGIEDTVYYRNTTLISLCEVGGDITVFSRSIQTLHNFAISLQNDMPYTLTAGSTHDNKRSEDIRSILSILSENSEKWIDLLKKVQKLSAKYRTPLVDAVIENAIWQTVLGTWNISRSGGFPIESYRLKQYAQKHMREAKTYTTWRRINQNYEEAMLQFCDNILQDENIIVLIQKYVSEQFEFIRSAILSVKAIQLTMTGIPDLYQGSEVLIQKLVDPDNRTLVDFDNLENILNKILNPDYNPELPIGTQANLRINVDYKPLNIDEEKMIMVYCALNLRNDYKDAFIGVNAKYLPLAISSDCAFGFTRYYKNEPKVVTIVNRYSGTRSRHGGYGDHYVKLPNLPENYDKWQNVLTGDLFDADDVKLVSLFKKYPVVLLEPTISNSIAKNVSVWAPNAKEVKCYTFDSKFEFDSEITSKSSIDYFQNVKHLKEIEMKKGTTDYNGTSINGVWHSDELINDRENYYFKIDNSRFLPDPCSRRQKYGVHGPSTKVNSNTFMHDNNIWQGKETLGKIFYEIHIGTFTKEGTFKAAIEKLSYLVELGVDVVELMPVNVFDGEFGWGYDCVNIYAINEQYGGICALQEFIQEAHRLGLIVCLDVVYNHVGPNGNYLNNFGPYYTQKHTTPWGLGFNFDDDNCEYVRKWILDSALQCIDLFGVDALRIDAAHEIHDNSEKHILRELSENIRIYSLNTGRKISLIAESDENDSNLLNSLNQGGIGFNSTWSDDFHHALYSFLANENIGYYSDFCDFEKLIKALKQGIVYDSVYSQYRNAIHGTEVLEDLDLRRLVVFFSNHDQIGNRALGDRPNFRLNMQQLQIASALTLLSPFSPLIFQGEEWGASTPFEFFASFSDESLNNACREGRKAEFSRFNWNKIYGDDVVLPDPISIQTFKNCKLLWDEKDDKNHGELLKWYKDLIQIRKRKIGHQEITSDEVEVLVFNNHSGRILIYRHSGIAVVCNLSNDFGQVGMVFNEKRPQIKLSNCKSSLSPSGVLKISPNGTVILEY